MKNLKGSLILLTAAFIWGTAFVAQTTASKTVGPFSFTSYRSLVGALFLCLLAFLRAVVSSKKEKKHVKETFLTGWNIKGGGACGILIFFAINLQQAGITYYPEEAAASGRSGFLTAQYVIIVALISLIMGKMKNIIVILSAIVAAVGMYFLCLSGGIHALYFGDLLCFLCAFGFAAHIFMIEKCADSDPVKLSCMQFLVTGLISLVVSFFVEKGAFYTVALIKGNWFSIFYLGVMSSGVAYTLQMVGQKYAEPAVTSIVMSMESVFAVLAGVILLHERLSVREILGCILLFIAVIGAQIPDILGKRKKA